MTDWADVYRSNVEAVTALAEGLSPEQLSLPVPATPEWDVHDVLAHLAGTPADALGDRMDGAPSAEWTARHVGERSERTVEELVAEIRSSVEDVVATLEGNDSPGLVWNAAVHHADLHEALGLGVPPEPMWRPVLEGIAPRVLRDNAAALEHVPDYELFRALFSRRSRSQMTGWGASVDPEWLDQIGLFGPRDDDQPMPEGEH